MRGCCPEQTAATSDWKMVLKYLRESGREVGGLGSTCTRAMPATVPPGSEPLRQARSPRSHNGLWVQGNQSLVWALGLVRTWGVARNGITVIITSSFLLRWLGTAPAPWHRGTVAPTCVAVD